MEVILTLWASVVFLFSPVCFVTELMQHHEAAVSLSLISLLTSFAFDLLL